MKRANENLVMGILMGCAITALVLLGGCADVEQAKQDMAVAHEQLAKVEVVETFLAPKVTAVVHHVQHAKKVVKAVEQKVAAVNENLPVPLPVFTTKQYVCAGAVGLAVLVGGVAILRRRRRT